MKKVLILLITIFLLSGCMQTERLNSSDIDKIFKTFLSKDTELVNNSSKGYKYYVPKGVRVNKSENYNEELNYNGYTYYLFVDVVSYYYKTSIDYEVDNTLFYSNILNYNEKIGFAEIEKIKDLYRIKIHYNYASIETYVDYNNIKQSLINMSYILNSIKFNDSITEFVIGNDNSKLGEETFDFYTPRKKGNFIDYINKYDEYEEPTDNNLGNEENE